MTDNTRRSDIESGNEGAADAEMTAAAPEDIEYLFAQSATGLGIGRDGHITLHEAAASTLWFSDRPYRLAGHIETQDFVAEWGRGDDNFAEDPPNAVLSTIDGDKVNDVVVVLSDPSLDGKDLSYAVSVIEGSLEPAPGPVSLFIDVIGRPLTPVSLAGARRRGMRRERRRMT